MLGVALRRQGDARSARDVMMPLVEFQPRARTLRFELGQALGAIGEHRAAIAVLSQAINIYRRYPEAWRALGEQLAFIGDRAGADSALAQAELVSAEDPELQKAIGSLQAGKLDEAEELLVELLEKKPADATIIKLLAEVALRARRGDDAEALFEQCLEIAPDNLEARASFISALLDSNKNLKALEQAELLVPRDPRNPAYRNLKGHALIVNDRIADAFVLYDELVRDYPGDPGAWLGYAQTLGALRRDEESVAAYRKIVELFPWMGGAYLSLASLRGYRFDYAEIAAAERNVVASETSEQDRTLMHFALGRVYENQKRYENSFEHYKRGNALQNATLNYDPDVMSTHVEICKELFTPQFFHARAGKGDPARDPIFILGMPRAGSSLIEQMLSSHSAIEGVGELGNMIALVRQAHFESGGDYPDFLADIDPAMLADLGERYLDSTRGYRKTGKRMFTDKAPSNFSDIGFIHMILPNAKIIDARRHPVACCFSNFTQHFARGQDFTYDQTSLGRYYRDYVALMAHFDRVLPGRIHRVLYEDMVADPENELRKILDYLEVPFEEQCLSFHTSERYVRTASSDQVREPIFKSAVEHWKHYEEWLDPLKAALGPVLDFYPAVPPL
jgi:predicted Zn-dependent protease